MTADNKQYDTGTSENVLLNHAQLGLILQRLALQLVEEQEGNGEKNMVFIGLQPRGIFISDALVNAIAAQSNGPVLYGKLDITFYRDDVRREIHNANQTDIPFSIENKTVVLIDDVLYTGRTVRAALNALQSFGRPKVVKLCVLVNRRFGRELPIQPDYCGISIDTFPGQKVKVEKEENVVILYS